MRGEVVPMPPRPVCDAWLAVKRAFHELDKTKTQAAWREFSEMKRRYDAVLREHGYEAT